VTGPPRTLREHVSGYRVYAQCGSCRHNVRLNLLQAAQVAGWDATLDDIRPTLKCGVCGNRGAIALQVVPELRRPPPNG
jgi:bacterioferritin-associated ferredoxin